MVVFNATCRKYSEQVSLSGGVGREEFSMEIRRVGEVEGFKGSGHVNQTNDRVGKKRDLGRRVSYQGVFFLRRTETSSALRYQVRFEVMPRREIVLLKGKI